jgi:hypothetical protein
MAIGRNADCKPMRMAQAVTNARSRHELSEQRLRRFAPHDLPGGTDGNWNREMIQRREGLWLHHPR